MSKLTDKLLERIEQENIKPRPRIIFAMRSMLIWLVIVMAGLLSAVGSGVLYLKITQLDLSLAELVDSEFVAAIVPGLWLAVAGLFLYAVYLNFRYTPLGYRPSALKVWLTAVGLTLLLGGGFYASGISSWTDAAAQEQIPAYKKMCDHAIEKWMNPEQGRLMGTILERNEEGSGFIFADIRGVNWHVDATHAIWRGERFYQHEKQPKVRIIGRITAGGSFTADEIRPWPGSGAGSGRGKGQRHMHHPDQQTN